MRRQIVEFSPNETEAASASTFVQTSRGTRDKPWWQSCGISEFKKRASGLLIEERLELLQEIRGALVVIQQAIQDPRDEDHRRRAKASRAYVEEKHAILKGIFYARHEEIPGTKSKEALLAEREFHERNRQQNQKKSEEREERRKEAFSGSRRALEKGETHEALNILLNLFEEDLRRELLEIEAKKIRSTVLKNPSPKKLERREFRQKQLLATREFLDAGDVHAALKSLLDLLMPKES